MDIHFQNGLFPAEPASGFRMDGYYVWCGSCIRGDDGKYYLFASRWPKETGFPDGYMHHSEIVIAVTDALDKPFQLEQVLFSGRPGGYWDSQMAHNPQILRIGDEYLLFYIGTEDGTAEKRKIGIAHSRSLTEGWVRPDAPLALPDNANNPAAVITPDGGILLAYRDGELKVSTAYAPSYDQPFFVLKYDIFPLGRIEDMYLFRNGDRYEIIAEDNGGTYTGLIGAGVHFSSADGRLWELCEPMQVYDRTVTYTDGTTLQLQRRERPQLLFDEELVYLFTTAKINGATREAGGITWNMVQKYRGSIV